MHRKNKEWKKNASFDLSHGRTSVNDTYAGHDRISDGDAEDMIDAAYTAWRADRDAGRDSVLIAETREDVTALNARARADLILDGTIRPTPEVALAESTSAGVGDTIITRRNDRRLRTGTGRCWVINGERWQIADVREDGSITIRKPSHRFGSIVMPAGYVSEHVDLGYAVTAHRDRKSTRLNSSHVSTSDA